MRHNLNNVALLNMLHPSFTRVRSSTFSPEKQRITLWYFASLYCHFKLYCIRKKKNEYHLYTHLRMHTEQHSSYSDDSSRANTCFEVTYTRFHLVSHFKPCFTKLNTSTERVVVLFILSFAVMFTRRANYSEKNNAKKI